MELSFPPPIDQPVKQFVGQCGSFCPGKETLSDKFVALLRCSNPQVVGNARGLLTNVAQFPENKDPIRELGLFEDIVEVLKTASNNPPLQLGVIAGLANLVSDCPENQATLQSTEFTSIITPQFSSLQGDAKEQCLRIIMHLSRNQNTNEALANNRELIEAVYNTLPPASTKEYTLSIEYALSVGVGLAENTSNGDYLVNTSIGAKIVDYMTSPVLALRLYALKSIRLLAEECQAWRGALAGGGAGISADGCFPSLLPQIKSKNESILQLSLFVLRNISKGGSVSDDYGNLIRKKMTAYAPHIVPILLEMIQPSSGQNEKVTKLAYMALSEVLDIEEMQDAFVQQRGVKSLIELIYGGSKEVATASASLLASLLSNNDKILGQFIEQQELTRLLQHISSISDDDLKSSLLGVLANILLCSDDLREQFFESQENLKNVVAYLEYPHEGCKRNALRATVNLTLLYQKIPMLLQDGINVLQHVQRILDSQSSLGPLAMSLLVNLTSNEEVHGKIIEKTKSLQWVVDYLKQSDDTKKLSGLKLITNFAVKGRNRKWFHEHPDGVVDIIDKLKQSANPEIATQAESAAVNLSFPFEAHYENEEVENQKALPEIVDVEELENDVSGSVIDSEEILREMERLSEELAKAEAEKKKIQEEQEELERARERAAKEAEILAKQKEEEEAARIAKQREDEERLRKLQEEEEKLQREEEAKKQAELAEKQRVEEELQRQQQEAEEMRKKIMLQKEAEEKQMEAEKKRQELENFRKFDQEETNRSEKEISELQMNLATIQSQIDNIMKKLTIVSQKREKRERKLSRSLVRSERTQKKLNRTLKSSPKKAESTAVIEEISSKHAEIQHQSEEYQKKLRRIERSYKTYVSDRENLEEKRKEEESKLEQLLMKTETERKERAEKLIQLQADVGEEINSSTLENIENDLKERENQLAKLQAQREEQTKLAAKQEEEQKQRREKFLKEKEALREKIKQQEEQEKEIRKQLQQEEDTRQKIEKEEQEKARLALQEKEKEVEEARNRAAAQLAKQKEAETAGAAEGSSDPKKKMSVRRTNIAREIYDTEKSYVASLRTLVWKFQKPLQQQNTSGKKGAISLDDIRILFSNVEMILNFNKILLEGIEQRLRNWSDEQALGDIFIKLTDFLRIYVDYVNNFDHAIELSTKLKKKNPDFAKFLIKAERIPACRGLTFESFLIMPVQRVPRYVMLLMDLLKNTWKDHPDYSDIEAALKKMQETGDFINESKRNAEAAEKMQTLSKSISGKVPNQLIAPHRKYVHEGTVKWVGNYTVQLFLFSDILLVTKPGRNNSYDSKLMIDLTQISINKGEDTKKDAFPFKIGVVGDNKKNVEHVFVCTTEIDRDSWIKFIYQQADAMATSSQSFRKSMTH